MTLGRRDPLTGATVVTVGSRQARPDRPAGECPFCPGGLEAPEPYVTRRFVNRWPAMPDDRCEVVLYAPEHAATFSSLGVEGAARVVRLWSERTDALGRRPDVAYVLVFENRGPEVGATIDHPHGQVYAFDTVPPAPAAELEGPCRVCPGRPEELVVARRGEWSAWVPPAPAWPFELRVAPGAHLLDLPAAASTHEDLAAVLVDALARLDRLFDAPMPYMLWVHQRPTDGGEWPSAHVHVHVAPMLRAPGSLRFVAAGELGSGMFFNPVPPEEAARRLREA